MSAAREAGNPTIDDINADRTLGYLRMQEITFAAHRYSTAKAFLVLAKHRPNLHIIKNALVEKILINKNNVAYGVKFRYKGTHIFRAIARKEVILSAGSVMSSQVLMLSGMVREIC